jgi:hypothetical protein
MTNPAGRLWENKVRDYLCDVFPGMDRAVKHGRFDKGEFINTGDWTLECKATKAIDLSGALDQAVVEQKHNGTKWHAAIIKRRNHDREKAYVVMTLAQFKDLLMQTVGEP